MSNSDTLPDYWSIKDEIDMLEGYLNLGQKNHIDYKKRLLGNLAEEIKKYKKVENIRSDIPDEEIINYAESIVDSLTTNDAHPRTENEKIAFHISGICEGIRDTDYYVNTLYASVVILLYSCIERGLIKCFSLVKSNNNKNVIQQVKDILLKQNSDITERQVWKEIKFIRWLRNTIVHSGMSFSLDEALGDIVYESWGSDAVVKAEPVLLEYLKRNNIYIKEYGQIVLNIEFCKETFKLSRDFFYNVLSDTSK
jgi:hypothetical protein